MTGLYLDTSTERLLVGVVQTDAGKVRTVSRSLPPQTNHASSLLPTIKEILNESGIGRPEVIGIALGPGSFTGLRIGLSTAKGLAEGWGLENGALPLVGLDSLEAMAMTFYSHFPDRGDLTLPVIDARKKKFYAAGHSRRGRSSELLDLDAEALLARFAGTERLTVTGYQALLLKERLGEKIPAQWDFYPLNDWGEALAGQLVRRFQEKTFLTQDATPLYLRLSEAEENRQRQDKAPVSEDSSF